MIHKTFMAFQVKLYFTLNIACKANHRLENDGEFIILESDKREKKKPKQINEPQNNSSIN